MARTFAPLEQEDLREIQEYSLAELHRFLYKMGNPTGKFSIYENKIIAICLCQGAAQHFVDLQNNQHFDNEVTVNPARIAEKGLQVLPDGKVISGVKDIDVCFFFEHLDNIPIPSQAHCRKRVSATFQRLGQRDIDFLKKGIRLPVIQKSINFTQREIIRSYLIHTNHGRSYLSKKSVIGLHPENIFGDIFWKSRRNIDSLLM